MLNGCHSVRRLAYPCNQWMYFTAGHIVEFTTEQYVVLLEEMPHNLCVTLRMIQPSPRTAVWRASCLGKEAAYFSNFLPRVVSADCHDKFAHASSGRPGITHHRTISTHVHGGSVITWRYADAILLTRTPQLCICGRTATSTLRSNPSNAPIRIDEWTKWRASKLLDLEERVSSDLIGHACYTKWITSQHLS